MNIKNKIQNSSRYYLCAIILCFLSLQKANAQQTPDYRNFYGICWRGNAHENLLYARQMKYQYVFYQKGMELDSLSNGLYFYLETPEYLTYDRVIDTAKTYTDKAKKFYLTYCALKDSSYQIPNGLACGWFFNRHAFSAQLDFQQKAVIQYGTDSILNYVKQIMRRNPKFHFGGYAWDVPDLKGDFYNTALSTGHQTGLRSWTGGDYGMIYPGTTHDYDTYTNGHIEFYKQLFKQTKQLFPGARFIMEPNKVYDDWVRSLKGRPDAREFMPDLLCQESKGTEFVSDSRITASGLITDEQMASTCPGIFPEEDNRVTAANAAIKGASFCWYGRFGGSGNMPNFQNISQVPARLQLIRVLTNWENLNQTPLSDRAWDGAIYKSNSAYVSKDIIAITQPNTGNLFVVFNNPDQVIHLPQLRAVKAVYRTNKLFIKEGNAEKDIEISKDKQIRLLNKENIGQGYIIEFKQKRRV